VIHAPPRASGEPRQAAERFRRLSFVIDNFSVLEGLGKFSSAAARGEAGVARP